jgi:hypothetical protein
MRLAMVVLVAVAEQDCAKAVVLDRGNLLCR